MIELYMGDNVFLISETVKKRITEFAEKYGTLGVERYDAEDLSSEQLKSIVMQLAFLVESKLVVIKGLWSQKHLLDTLAGCIDDIPNEISVLVVDSHPDKRTALYKMLKDRRLVREFSDMKPAELEEWAISYALANGSKLDRTSAKYLISHVGKDQLRLSAEIQKLSFSPVISSKSIEELVEKEISASIFDLLEATFRRDKSKANNLLAELFVKRTEPLEITGMMGWQLHTMLLTKVASLTNESRDSLLQGIHPFVISKAETLTRTVSFETLKKAIDATIETEVRIKTSAVSPHECIRMLILDVVSL